MIKMKPQKTKLRFWEIDFLRGIGITFVVIFHLFFDLNYFGILQNSMYSGLWLIFQRFTASLLILLVGISLVLSYEREKEKNQVKNRNDKTNNIFPKFLKRSAFLFAIASIITIITWGYPHEGFIVFGILHFIALAILLGYLFLRFFYLNLFLGFAMIIAGTIMNRIPATDNSLLLFGLSTADFYSLDYFPLLPWFGIVLVGIFVGKYFYSGKRNVMRLSSSMPKSGFVRFFNMLGQNSLLIYLVHQLVLFGLLFGYLFLQ